MTISAGDIKFVKSQVMDDTTDGGGSPTSVVIVDGQSNAIMPDVSELDRAMGRVNLRKVAVIVDTENTDTYLGSNVIVAEPPDDPNISITLFQTDDFFDQRDDAVDRIQAYLSIGTAYPGFLYGNHIAGQATVQIYQSGTSVPTIGDTLVLTKLQGQVSQVRQYVRVIDVGITSRSFEDDKGAFSRNIVTLRISATLIADFPGFDVQRADYTKAQLAANTGISNTVVADAAKYYGVVELAEDAAIGDFTIKAASVYAQLVPSAQIETPIADARTNQLAAAAVSGGAAIVQPINAIFNPTNNLFIGGGIAPGTLSIVNGSNTVTDSGGRLMNGGAQVGTVDYANGILYLTVDVFGGASIAFVVTYQPAVAATSVNQSQGIPVTVASRSQSYVRTFNPIPAPGTIEVSYMAQGRWYVLYENGDGAIRGDDAAYGAGNLNFQTGTMTITLGALPDVDTDIIFTWVQPDAARSSDSLTLDNSGNLYWPFNTSGQQSLSTGSKSIDRGALSITWTDAGGTLRTITDDSNGNLTGYGTGSVSYSQGVMRVSPTVLPAPGTVINVSITQRTPQTATVAIASGHGNVGVTNITPGSFSMDVSAQMKAVYMGNPVINWGAAKSYRLVDDGAGNLLLLFNDYKIAAGTINYSTGDIALSGSPLVLSSSQARAAVAWDNIFLRQGSSYLFIAQ